MRRFLFTFLALVIASAQTVLLVQPASAAMGPTISAPADGSTISDRTPLIQGTYDPSDGGNLVLQIDGVQAYTENAGIPGGATEQAWQFEVPTDLDYGDHKATAIFDGLEGSHGEASISFTIAQPGPGAPVLFDPADGAVTGDQVTATGVIADGGTVPTSVRVFVDGSYLDDADLDGVDWRLALPTLGNGSHSVYAVARDDDGNDSDRSNTSTFTVDGTAPAVPVITFPATGYYENQNVTFRGTGEPGARLTIIYEYGTFALTVPQSGEWEQDAQPLELGEGTHTFSVRQTDDAGNTSPTSDEVTYTYDATAPAAPVINAPQTGDTLSDETFSVTGFGERGATVTVFVNGQSVGTALVDSDADWSVTGIPSRPNGTRVITATQADRADNESTVSDEVTISVQLTPAPPVISKPIDGSYTNGGRVFDREIVGTADADSTVRVLRDGVQIAEVIADQDGRWGYVPPAPFPDGTYELTATATNAAGTSEPSAAVTQTYDTVAPAAPVIATPTPNAFVRVATLTGTTEPGARVFLVYQGTVIEGLVATADNAGRWTLSFPGISDGTYDFGVLAADRASNPGPASAPVTFTVDTRAPAVPVVEMPVNGQRVGALVPVNGQGEPNATVTVRVGSTVVGTALVDSDGVWQLVTDELDEGDVTLSVTQTDRAGNVSAAVGVDLVVDSDAPAAPVVTSPDDGEAAPPSEPVTFGGTAEPGASVTLRLDDGDPDAIDIEVTVQADPSGNWEYTSPLPLPEGSYLVTAVQTDLAGNSSERSAGRRFVVDGTPPAEPVVITPKTGDTVPPFIQFQGRGEPGATINVNHFQDLLGTTTVLSDGTWSLTTTQRLPEGENTDISVQQVDRAGNASESSVLLTLFVDGTAPEAPVINQPTQATSTLLTLTGTGAPGSTITVFFGEEEQSETATVDDDGNWSLDLIGVRSGSYTITATATDAAGNESDLSRPRVIQVSADPVITVPEEGQIYTIRRPTFEGTGEPGATIVVRGVTDADLTAVVKSKLVAAAAPGDVLAIGVVDQDGNWTATPTTDLESGLYSIVAEQTQEGLENRVSEVVDFAVVTKPVITNPASGAELDDSFLVCGTGEPGFTVEIVDLADAADDNATVYGVAEVDNDGTWCADVRINTDGVYDLVARQGLDGEFEATSDPISITVDGDDSSGGSDSSGSSSGDSLASTGGPPAAAGLLGMVLLGLGTLTIRSRRRFSSRRG